MAGGRYAQRARRRAAYDEIVATAVKRQHEPQRVVGDLLTADLSEKQARSINYQIAAVSIGAMVKSRARRSSGGRCWMRACTRAPPL